jgi:hypothetical protein
MPTLSTSCETDDEPPSVVEKRGRVLDAYSFEDLERARLMAFAEGIKKPFACSDYMTPCNGCNSYDGDCPIYNPPILKFV